MNKRWEVEEEVGGATDAGPPPFYSTIEHEAVDPPVPPLFFATWYIPTQYLNPGA